MVNSSCAVTEFLPLLPPTSYFSSASVIQNKQINGKDTQVSEKNADNLGATVPLPESLCSCAKKRGRESRKMKCCNTCKGGPSISAMDTTLAPVGCRYESSLGLLTKKFINMVHEFEDGIINLNVVAEKLQLRKRRLYDITNVLEGIGFIEKTSKSLMCWTGSDLGPCSNGDQVCNLQEELKNLNAEEIRLDACIREKQEQLQALHEDETNRRLLFLNAADIMTLPPFQNQTVFIIKAPQASYVEVPDPEKDSCFPGKQYRIILKSSTGAIDLFHLRKIESRHDDIKFRGGNSAKMASANQHSNNVEAKNQRHASANRMDDLPSVDNGLSAEPDIYQIQKITSSDLYSDRPEGDYWLQSDIAFTMTNLWAQ